MSYDVKKKEHITYICISVIYIYSDTRKSFHYIKRYVFSFAYNIVTIYHKYIFFPSSVCFDFTSPLTAVNLKIFQLFCNRILVIYLNNICL